MKIKKKFSDRGLEQHGIFSTRTNTFRRKVSEKKVTIQDFDIVIEKLESGWLKEN